MYKKVRINKSTKKASRIADNKLADLADYDEDFLKLELEELQDLEFDLELTGVGLDVIGGLLGDEEPEITVDQKDLSEEVGETFEVVIACNDEREQEETYNKLVEEGYECRVLTL